MSKRVRYGDQKGRDRTKDPDLQKEPRTGPSGDRLDWDEGLGSLDRPMYARIILMQIMATIALALLFYLNWYMKPKAFDVRQYTTILSYPIEYVTITGLVVSAIICITPTAWERLRSNWEKIFGFKFTTGRGLFILAVIMVIIIAVLRPAVFAGYLVELFIAFFYLATLLFGVYGIWRMKGTHIITSGMFTFFTALSVPQPFPNMNIVLVFALSFLLFMELSSSAMRQYLLAYEELVPLKFQTRMVDRYLLYLGLFTLLTVGLTYLAVKARWVLNIFSPLWTRESLEVQGFLGILLPAIGVLFLIMIVRYAMDWRTDRTMRAAYKDKKIFEGKSPWAVARALLRNEG
jgi:hypothetical protein